MVVSLIIELVKETICPLLFVLGKVLIGMGPLKSAEQGDWIRKNLWGVNISDEILHRLEVSDSPEETGEQICQELIEKIMELPCIDGVHLMGPNCEKGSARIISRFR